MKLSDHEDLNSIRRNMNISVMLFLQGQIQGECGRPLPSKKKCRLFSITNECFHIPYLSTHVFLFCSLLRKCKTLILLLVTWTLTPASTEKDAVPISKLFDLGPSHIDFFLMETRTTLN